jgi:diguanylate cyclase (GGDEF)-like protein
MDMFKEVNDTLGHAAGDLVLVTAAQRLRESVRGTDSVLRIGGDEFIVVMPDVQEDSDIRRVAAKITSAISNGGPAGLENVRMSCSIGIAIYPTQATSADELFSRADAAMYEAKRRGGGCFEVYSEGTPGFAPKAKPTPRRVVGARPALVVPQRSKQAPLFPDA